MSVMKGLTLTTKEQTRLSIMNGVLQRQWTVAEAAQLLGVSERHTWRLLSAYRMEGAAALAHGNRGRLPLNTTPEKVKTQVIALARERYRGINYTQLAELLAEREGILLSRSTVRRLLVGAGLASPRHRKQPCHRYRRARMPQEGMLVQIDGSHHRWLEERGPYITLLLAVDDATGTVPYALFREQEDTEGYFCLTKGIIQRRGIPLALYSDRYFVFCYSKPASEAGGASIIDRSKPTQFGRAMQELGVTQVFARSPEAKGRVERANGTFQDRLVAELRLSNASTIEAANSILEAFLPRFNERFGVPAAQPETAYRQIDPGVDIEGILCFKERRRVARDNTVQYHGRTLQLFPGSDRRSYARTYVEVQERLDGQMLVHCRGKLLTPGEAPPLATTLRNNANMATEALMPFYSDHQELETEVEPHEPQHKVIWYADPEMKVLHSNLIKTGMEQARQHGKRIGRPRVSEKPDFNQRLADVLERINSGILSRRKAARELCIGYATLKRIIDAQKDEKDGSVDSLLASVLGNCNDKIEVLN
jgi:transposase